MMGTPSRTATACDDGKTRHSVAASANTPRGHVGRKLQAKLRSEEYEAHMRQPKGGRGSLAVQSPIIIQTQSCKCDGYVEQKSRALPREICLSVCETESDKRLRHSRKRGPGRSRWYDLGRGANFRTTLDSGNRLGKPRGQRWAGRSQQNP